MHNNRYSFSTGALFPLESEDALRLIGEAGFGNAELMPQAFCDVTDAAASRFEKCGVHIASIHYPLAMFSMLYSAHVSMSEEGRRFSEALVKLAHRMGTEFIVIHPTNEYSGVMKDVIEPRVLDNIRFLCAAADRYGITVAMENYPSGVGQYPDTLQAYTEAWGISNMKVMVDTTEVIEGGGDPVDFIARLNQAPCHLHMSDYKDGRKHLPAGQGMISWDTLFSLLKSKGYSGYWTLEPAYRFYMVDLPEKLSRDFEFISSHV